jgi:phosphatidylglycerol:prolipoprotein diacylglycerol transferase
VSDLFRAVFAPPRHLILLLVALWMGLLLAEKRVTRYHLSKDVLNNIIFYSILGYIIGGRLLYALSNLPSFLRSPLSLFSLNLDLFDPWGALATAGIVGLVYSSRQKLPLWSTLDALTPFFAVLMIGVALTHLAAGTAFGAPTNLPWGIHLWSEKRHPTQIYELLASLFIFGLIWFRRTQAPGGMTFLLFAAWTAGARLFLEAFRGDSTLIGGGLRLAQIVAWLLLAGALLMSEYVRKQERVE